MFDKSLKLIENGTGTAFPCAAVAIGLGYNVFARSFFGFRQLQPEILRVTENTLFDLASLTKLTATTMVALKFIESGKLSLEDSIGKYLDFTGNYTDCKINHLMTHSSGMPAGLPLFSIEHKSSDVLHTILSAERCCKTGEEVIYSCMGYIVLGAILEKVGKAPLDRLCEALVFEPLGMNNTCYKPDSSLLFAATEKYLHSGEWATGHVHDENAHFLGGVSGNAGVFSTLDDMIQFAGMCSSAGLKGDGTPFLKRETFDSAIKNLTPYKNEARGLGFQVKGNGYFPGGELLSEGSFGHTGFTGTSLYVDNETRLWGILLTNAVHFGRDNRDEYFSVRRAFYDMIITEYRAMTTEDKI